MSWECSQPSGRRRSGRAAGWSAAPQGETLYNCEATIFYDSTCGCKKLGPQTVTDTECATSTPEAEKKSATFLTTQKYRGARGVFTINCVDTAQQHLMAEKPNFKLQSGGSCSVSAGDNPCLACMATSCCSETQACLSDSNCLCWVGCKYAGNTDEMCALPGNCGGLNAVSSAAATCLDAQCAAECGTMATMGSPCGCMDSTGAGGGGAASCTPGSFGPGETCSSDGDCASCSCNAQSMTCD